MSPTPLAERVVEVIADLGEGQSLRHRYGSGCIVAGRTVLTAAHVVTGAVRVQVRDAHKVLSDATLNPKFVGDTDGPGPDLALIEINTPGIDLPPMVFAAVDRDSPTGDPVERCHAIGYPTFMERKTPDGVLIRDTVDACGQVPVLSRLVGGLLSVQVSSTPQELPPKEVALGDSQWAGMSGGPLVADGDVLGVVTEHAQREGSSAITVTPLTALDADPAHPGWGTGVADPGAWWERLGISGVDALRRLPAQQQRVKPAYWATVREIHSRTTILLGRQRELAEITAFATGPGGYRWLVGGAWAGKTSLLAEAVAAVLPGQVDVVSYFLSRREADADSARFLQAVIPQLAYLCAEDHPAADVHEFRALWERAAERATSQNRHLLLVVDGLDEDLLPPGLPSVAVLLPSVAGGRAHVLVGSRPYPGLPSDIPIGHSLRSTHPTELEPFAGSQALAELAQQEIGDLMRRDRDDDGLAVDVLGLLTAAGGPLAVMDLATLTGVAPRSTALVRRIRHLITDEAARVLQPVGPATERRYQFAHVSLLEHAQANDDLNDPDFRNRIHQWAQTWHDAGWPCAIDHKDKTPPYLLDTYPSTLAKDPERLVALVSDAGWVVTAIPSVGVDAALIDLRKAAAADPSHTAVAAMLAAVAGQAHHLRPPQPLSQPGFVLRQLWLQAAELTEGLLADDLRARLRSQPGPGLVPRWTTRRASRALSGELGTHDTPVRAVAVLPDGRVVSGGRDGQVLVWNPAMPGTGPVELGAHDGTTRAVAVLPDGRVVSGGADQRVLVWDTAMPGTGPLELGRHEGQVRAVAVLPDGRVVSGGDDGRVLLWDPATPGTGPLELGRQDKRVWTVAVLLDGRVVSGGADWRVRVWDPAMPGADPLELGRHRGQVRAVTVLPDARVASGGDDGRVRVWDPAMPGASMVKLGRHKGPVWAVAVLPDGRVVSGGTDRQVRVWDPAMPGTDPIDLGQHDQPVWAVAVLPDGRVVSVGEDGRVRVWDPTMPGANSTPLGPRDVPVGTVQAVAVLPDGRVVSGDFNGRVLVWDPARPGTDPVELGQHNGPVWAVAVLPDGRVISGEEDRRVLVWDPARPGTDPVELGQHDGPVWAVAVLPDGRVISGGVDRRVRVWDPDTPGSNPVDLGQHDQPVRAVAVLPDGRVVSGGQDERVLVWDPAMPGTGPVELGRHERSVVALAVLPEGRVVSGGEDRRVLVWDVTTGTEIAQVGCSVNALAAELPGPGESCLIIAHEGAGFSHWSITDCPPR